MASSRSMNRLLSRLKPIASNSTKKSILSELSSSNLTSKLISRLPLRQLSAVDSMMPLHSAIASSRLISSLSIESHLWGLVPQGISMPL